MRNCGLSGSLPSDLLGKVQLQTIDLSSNLLTGAVPQEWVFIFEETLPRPQYIDVSHNLLNGSVSEPMMLSPGL